MFNVCVHQEFAGKRWSAQMQSHEEGSAKGQSAKVQAGVVTGELPPGLKGHGKKLVQTDRQLPLPEECIPCGQSHGGRAGG